MNVDRQYRIRIDLQSDVGGATRAATELGKVGASAEHGGKHLHEMHRAFHALNEVIPGLGLAMQAAFSPIGATIGLAVMALRMFHEQMKKADEEMKKAAEEAAKPLTGRMEAQRDQVVRTTVSLTALYDKLIEAAKGEESVTKAAERNSEALKEQFERVESLADARKEFEIANLEATHKQGLLSEEDYGAKRIEIELAFAAKKRSIQEGEEMAKIMARRREIESAEADQAKLTDSADDAARKHEAALTALGSLTPREEIVQRFNQRADKLRDYENRHPEAAGFFQRYGPGAKPGQIYQAAAEAAYPASGEPYSFGKVGLPQIEAEYSEWSTLVGLTDVSRAELTGASKAEGRLKSKAAQTASEAERAAKLAEENQTFITEGNRDVSRLTAHYNAGKEASEEMGALHAGGVYARAGLNVGSVFAGAANAYRNTGDDQALAQAAAALGEVVGMKQQIIINMLRTVARRLEYSDSALDILENSRSNRTNVGGGF